MTTNMYSVEAQQTRANLDTSGASSDVTVKNVFKLEELWAVLVKKFVGLHNQDAKCK
jgi:hypothetical protein